MSRRACRKQSAHQKEGPAGDAVTVSNDVEMAQVSAAVKVILGRRDGTTGNMLNVDQLYAEFQRLNTTSQARQHVIPQHPSLVLQFCEETIAQQQH